MIVSRKRYRGVARANLTTAIRHINNLLAWDTRQAAVHPDAPRVIDPATRGAITVGLVALEQMLSASVWIIR